MSDYVVCKETFRGERPLYRRRDIKIHECNFLNGESAIKESLNVHAVKSNFESKYPLWHGDGIKIEGCNFGEGCRAAIWYSKNIEFNNNQVIAPKIFREVNGLTITDSYIETLEGIWMCNNVKVLNSTIYCEYLMFHCENIEFDNVDLDGKYSFQYTKNVVIRNSRIKSKDLFWNTENITVYDSFVDSQYIGWYSKNMKFVNCVIKGEQPFCYIDNLVMENCMMIDTDNSFELSSVEAEIINNVKSIKNPKSGKITVAGCDELIMEDSEIDKNSVEIIIDHSLLNRERLDHVRMLNKANGIALENLSESILLEKQQ